MNNPLPSKNTYPCIKHDPYDSLHSAVWVSVPQYLPKHTARIAYFKFCLNCLNIEDMRWIHTQKKAEAEAHFLCPIQVPIFLGLHK